MVLPETKNTLNEKSSVWFSDAKKALIEAADNRAAIGYLSTIDLDTTKPEDRHFPEGILDPSDKRFIEGLEGVVWNEHIQRELADLEDSRRGALADNQGDPIVSQFAELKNRLDHPNLLHQ
jgi:hypothetical protein